MTTNRSSEELAMRALIVPELRRLYPGARIVHELPLRYSTNRIDLAAITETEIVSVEIKSSRDVADRLEAQVRAFLPISSRVIVALAPKWNEQLPPLEVKRERYTSHIPQYTQAQEVIRRIGDEAIEIWTVDAAQAAIQVTRPAFRQSHGWTWQMLHILHVQELAAIASAHGVWQGKRPVHIDLVNACADLMSGREIAAAVCAALRARSAFAVGTDEPIPSEFLLRPREPSIFRTRIETLTP